MRPALLIFLLSCLLVSCSGKSHKSSTKSAATPQILNSQPGTSATPSPGGPSSGVVPPIISSGSSFISLGGPIYAGLASTQGQPPLPGLTVQHTESATVPADQAFVVAAIQGRGNNVPLPFATLTQNDQDQTTAALTAVGVKKEDITFGSSLNYGPFPSVTVKTTTADLPTTGKKIVDAIELVLGRSQSGVRFGLVDCRTALEPLRQKAIAATGDEAKTLAAGSSLTLGPITAVSQSTTPSSPVPTTSDPCNAGTQQGGPSTLATLDAKPEVTLSLQVSVTYSLGSSSTTNGLTATGSGTATAKADEAYIVVIAGGPLGSSGPQQVSTKNRTDLTQRLTALKLDAKDVQIIPSPNNGQIVVGVEVPLDRLPQAGKDVVGAVEDIFGRSQSQGVWFTHSNCTAVLAEARKQAAIDAKNAAQALATDAQVKLGSLIALSEVAAPAIGSTSLASPCDDNLLARFGLSYGTSDLLPFDATPQFTVKTAVTEMYAIGQ